MSAKPDPYGVCPECGSNWDDGNIFDALRTQNWCKDKTDEELQAYIHESYGPPYKFSRLVGVQLPYDHPEHYDGVSHWMCPDCQHQWPRFAKPLRTQA